MAFAAAIWMARKVSMQQKRAIPEESTLQAFCISFRPENKILLFPPAIETMRWLRMVVEQFWQIDTIEAKDDCYTLHLTGAPFLKHSSRESAILLKNMCCQILETFKIQNWQLVLCTDLSCKSDLTAWYFARTPPSTGSVDVAEGPNTEKSTAFVCLSLSKNNQLQLVNATTELQDSLKSCVDAYYAPGIDKDSRKGRDYEIKLKGQPWDPKNRLESVASCSLMINIFRRFHFNGYQLYGIVNLKETADSFIFEYDPSQTDENDRYMMIDIDENNAIRLVGAPDAVMDVVEDTLKAHWEPGIASKQRIDIDETSFKLKLTRRKTIASTAWEFKLNGSPWYTKVSKIGKARQLVTYLLDTLLANGWTVASGLETSRSSESKSDLLFQCCQPVPGIKHVCISPLGKNSMQIINAPASLRQLIRTELGNIVTREKLSSDQTQYELTLTDFPWDPDPHTDVDSYAEVRRRMGALLQALMDARWMVIASADVAHEAQEDAGDRVGIHSWFLIYTGPDPEHGGQGIRVTANSVLQVAGVAGRVGSSHSRMK